MSNLFFDVLESNITVSFIFLILYFFSGKLRKRYGAVWMKSVWLLLAIRLLVPYNFSLPSAEIRLFNTPAFEQEQRNFGEFFSYVSIQNNNSMMPEMETNTETDSVINFTEDITADTTVNITADPNNNIQNNTAEDMNNASYFHIRNQEVENNMQEENFTATQQQSFSINYSSYSALLTEIWMTGICLYFLYMLISCFIFHHKCKKSIQYFEYEEQQTYENRSYAPLNKEILAIQKKLTGKTSIPVYQSNDISTPMLIGIFRPKLIFPVFQKTWSKAELELMTAHELCHYKNKDLFLKLVILAACCINWFNPVIYMMKKQFFYDMELACDSQVLLNCSEEDRELYARIMLFFAGNKNKAPAFSTGFSEDKKQMKNRIDFIFDDHKKKKGIFFIFLICATVLTAGMLVSCGYKPQETGESGNDILAEADNNSDDSSPDTSSLNISEIPESSDYPDSEISEKNTHVQEFDYNNEYNTLIRCYENNVYLAQDDGIYLIKNGTAL